ncbi:MAG TPA: hypothetical protein VLS90_19575 [Thermodesulfobacteriota bacterium]|nr:hypothetical protein [Thermodesulfobacteriota bacterium]
MNRSKMSGVAAITGFLFLVAAAYAGAQSLAQDLAGSWNWVSGQRLVVSPDGACQVFEGNRQINTCQWTVIDASRRMIRITHRQGGWVDTVTLSLDGRTLDGTNNQNARIHGEKVQGQPQPPASASRTAKLNGWLSSTDGQYTGDFMGLGRRQILLVNRDPVGHPNEGKVLIAEFVREAFHPLYLETFGSNSLLDGWLDPEDLLLVGDFMGLGHDQVMLIDRTGTGKGAYFGNESRIMIVDFRHGAPPGKVLFRNDKP